MPFVTVERLNKYYQVGTQRIHVLRDLELAVERGEMVAVVGASGVGKSTLLHALGGLDRIDSGSIRVQDQELSSMNDDALVAFRNRNVGFVFQFHHLLPECDALENVEMPMRIARDPVSEARSRATALLARVGLGERLVHRPGMLSGGEQQRALPHARRPDDRDHLARLDGKIELPQHRHARRADRVALVDGFRFYKRHLIRRLATLAVRAEGSSVAALPAGQGTLPFAHCPDTHHDH